MVSTRNNIFYLAISQGANYLLPLLIYPVLIRAIGINDFGKISFAIVIMQLFFLVIEFGFGYSATKNIAVNAGNHQYLTQYFFKITGARFFLFLATMIILAVALLIPSLADIKDLLFIAMIAVFFNIINPNWFLQGLGMMKIMAVNSLISRGGSILVIYALIDKTTNMYIITFVLTFPYVYYSIASTLFLFNRGYIEMYRPTLQEITEVVREGAYFFFSTLATSAYTMLTPIVLGAVGGSAALGVFNSANLVKQGFAGLVAPVIQAFYPKVNVTYKEDKKKARNLVYRILRLVAGTFFVCSLPFILYSTSLASLLFGNKGDEIFETLRLMSFLPLVIAINSIIGLLILVPEGENKKYFNIVLTGGGVCLLLVYPLCHFYGAIGATISLIIAEVTVLLGMISYLIKSRIRGEVK